MRMTRKRGLVERLTAPNQFHGPHGEACEYFEIEPMTEMPHKLVTKATEADIAAARALGNQYDPDVYGRFPWVTRDYGNPKGKGLNVSKARLGLFFEALLRHGGDVTQIFAMGIKPGNYVQAMVKLTVQGRAAVEDETGITLERPPVMRVNT